MTTSEHWRRVLFTVATACVLSMSNVTLGQDIDELPPGKPMPGKAPAKSGASSSSSNSGSTSSGSSKAPAASGAGNSAAPGMSTVAWDRAAGLVARNYSPLGGDFVANLKWDPRYPSSSGLTVEEALDKYQYTTMVNRGLAMQIPVRVDIPRVEAEAAAMALPDVAPNEYGYILSANIKEIIGPDEMWLDQVWLIQEDEYTRLKQRQERELRGQESAGQTTSEVIRKQFEFRDRLVQKQEGSAFQRGFVLKGVPTAGLATKTRWSGDQRKASGIQIVFVGSRLQDASSTTKRKDRLLVAVPVDRFRPGLNEEQVRELLKKRNITPEQLVQMFEDEKRTDLRSAEIAVVRQLEAAREAIELKNAEAARLEKQQKTQRRSGSSNNEKKITPWDSPTGE